MQIYSENQNYKVKAILLQFDKKGAKVNYNSVKTL